MPAPRKTPYRPSYEALETVPRPNPSRLCPIVKKNPGEGTGANRERRFGDDTKARHTVRREVDRVPEKGAYPLMIYI